MSCSGVLFDLEGVLLQAKTYEPLAYAQKALQFCRERNLPFGIITNNTVELPESLLEILKKNCMYY